MEIERLRLFLDVAHRSSFAAVAKQHGLDPSSVSRAIAQLEEALDARLLQRSTRRMALTEAGERFRVHAEEIVEAWDAAAEDVHLSASGPTGRLRLTASVAFGEHVIAPLVPTFRERHPDLDLELIFSDANLDLVAESIDLAIRLAPRPTGDLVATRLFATRYRVCAAPAWLARSTRPRRPRDLSRHDCVRFSFEPFRSSWRFRRPRRGADAGPVETVPVSGGVSSSSALSVRALAAGGLGPALLADWLVRDDLEAGRLVDLFPRHEVTATEFETSAWIVYPSRRLLPRKVRVAIDFLKERLGA